MALCTKKKEILFRDKMGEFLRICKNQTSQEKYPIFVTMFSYICENVVVAVQLEGVKFGKFYSIILAKLVQTYVEAVVPEESLRIFIEYFYKLANIILRKREKICFLCQKNEPELMPCGDYNCCWKCVRNWNQKNGTTRSPKNPKCPHCHEEFGWHFFVTMTKRKREEIKWKEAMKLVNEEMVFSPHIRLI